MSKGLYVTDQQSEYEAGLAGNTVSFSYVARNYSAVPDSSVNVTSDEIRKYYDAHKETFKRPAQRDMEYIVFEITPSE